MVDGPDCIQTIFVPRHHYLISAAYRKLGDLGQANDKRPLGGMLLRAIAGTGMGTRAKPYQVLHLAAQEDFVGLHLKDKISGRACAILAPNPTAREEHVDRSRVRFHASKK